MVRAVGVAIFILLLHASLYLQQTSFCDASAAGTETLIGIVGKDFIVLGADSSVSQSIALTASNMDKIAVLVDPLPKKKNDGDGNNRASTTSAKEEDGEVDSSFSSRREYQQQCIAAAAAGDAADADHLLGLLTAHAAIREYEASVGCDVDFVDCSSSNNNNDDNSDQGDLSTTKAFSQRTTPAGLDAESAATLARGFIARSLRSQEPLRVCLLVAGMVMLPPPTMVTAQQEDGKHSKSDDDRNQQTKALASVSQHIQNQVKRASKMILGSRSEQEPTSSGISHAPKPKIKRRSSSSPSSKSKLLVPRLYWLDEYGSLQEVRYGAHGYGSNFCLSILDGRYRSDMSRQEAEKLVRDCFDQLRTRFVINSPQQPCIKCIDATGVHFLRQLS